MSMTSVLLDALAKQSIRLESEGQHLAAFTAKEECLSTLFDRPPRCWGDAELADWDMDHPWP